MAKRFGDYSWNQAKMCGNQRKKHENTLGLSNKCLTLQLKKTTFARNEII